MSDNQHIIVHTIEDPAPTFIKKKHELQHLAKLLQKGSADALQILLDTMNNVDSSEKLKLQIAKDILNYTITISDTISNDSIVRQVAQLKYNGGNEKNLKVLEQPAGPPILDFSSISNV